MYSSKVIAKIAILTDGIWPFVIGGMQKHSYYLCRYLVKIGVEVHLYHTVPHKASKPNLSAVFSKEELLLIKEFFITTPMVIKVPGHYLLASYLYSKKVHKLLLANDGQYNMLYIQGFSGWYTLLQKHNTNLPHSILNFHGLEMFQPTASFKNKVEALLFQPFAKKLLQSSDYVQSLGGKLTDILTSLKIPKHKIFVNGIGIEDVWFCRDKKNFQPQQRTTFTFIGRYERRKGITELTQILKRLVNLYDFEFHFVGPVPEERKLNHPNIQYHGLLNVERDIQAILDQTDFLVVPSYSEGLPTVILEAMTRCCAIIATDVGAVQEVVSDSNGILMGSPKDLESSFIKALHMSDSAISDRKKESRLLVEAYDWNKIVRRLSLALRFKP